MKLNNLKSWIPVAVLALGMNMTSCVGDLDVTPIDPRTTTEFNQDQVFTKIYASLALTGSEGPAGMGDVDGIDEGTSDLIRLSWNVNQMTTDEAKCNWGDIGIPELNNNAWSSSHSQLTGLYYRLYFDVTLCNFFLDKIADKTDDVSNTMRAEARFMRALNYYYLVDLFGNVPFTTSLSTSNPPRIERADLYAWILDELVGQNGCIANMKDAGTNTYGRADKAAGWMLAARLYLNAEVYTGTADWQNAALYAKKVMDSGYKLAPVYKNIFVADNNTNGAQVEMILPSLCDGALTRAYGASTFIIASTHKSDMPSYGTSEGWAGNRATKDMMLKFFPAGNAPHVDTSEMTASASDDRCLFYGKDRELEIGSETTEFVNGYSCTKFSNVRSDGKPSSDSKFVDTDFPVMRVAEAYLTFAEAKIRLNGESDTDAINAITDLRNRAGASTQSVYSLDFVLEEWSREFAFEGRRRIDLVRFGKFGGSNNYLWEWKGGVQTGTAFSDNLNIFPIPNKDLTNNDNLKQNPGY